MDFSAVILAGGNSSRMGRDKAFVELGGQTLLARQLQLLRNLDAAEIFISGRVGTDYSAFDVRVLHDQFSDCGPLGGIERALAESNSSLVLALAVDMPGMTVEVLRALLAHGQKGLGAIPRVGGGIEPLAAIYPKAGHRLAEQRLRQGKLAVRPFGEECVAKQLAAWVELPPAAAAHFRNLNTPGDLPVTRTQTTAARL